MADFTCALATGIAYSIPRRRRPPPMSTGGLPLRVRTSAPISRNGLATRSMGRFIKDASPINCEGNGCAASNPVNNRIAVPALPISSGLPAAFNPCSPTPWINTCVALGCSMRTPRARIAFNVAKQSSLAKNHVTSLVPSARPDNMSARCEMDLSPGILIAPETSSAGRAWKSRIRESGSSKHRSGIGAENLEQRGSFFQGRERSGDRRVAHMALDIDEEYIVPLALAGRPRLDARHVDPVFGQRFQQSEERAGIVG